GQTSEPVGPPPAASELGVVGGPSATELASGGPTAPSSPGTSRDRGATSSAAGPTIASTPRGSRDRGSRSRGASAIVAADPAAVALTEPLTPGPRTAMGPSGSG